MNQQATPASQKDPYSPVIESGLNDIIRMTDGREMIDLVSGFGTTLLGHAHPQIVEALNHQASRIWSTGRIKTDILIETRRLADTFSPASHRFCGFYSTGMEVAEYAIRVALKTTGRKGLIGFQRNMHGKSMATAYLCWQNVHADLPSIQQLPFLPELSEEDILNRLESILVRRETAAVLLEPFQGSGGGFAASKDFFEKVGSLAKDCGTLIVADEVLSGFYRTGTTFYHPGKNIRPDIVLSGKTMGNGFPVSAIFCHQDIELTPQMLPGSTFSENALAAAAVKATLTLMRNLDLEGMTGQIQESIRAVFLGIENAGFQVRGKGAFAVIEAPAEFDMALVQKRIVDSGVLASCLGPFIRLLPAATIKKENLLHACQSIRDAISS